MIKMDVHSFQGFSSRIGTDISYQTWDDNIEKERGIVCSPFGKVTEAVDPINGPKNRKQALFDVNFLSDSFWYFISRLGPY
jgi:hypothetical protein